MPAIWTLGVGKRSRKHGSNRRHKPRHGAGARPHNPRRGLSELPRNDELADLRHLNEEFLARYPRHASGAQWALAGFRFQFEQTLLLAVRDWLESQHSGRKKPRTFPEILADAAKARPDGTLVVSEVKRRLDRETVRAAVKRFEMIAELAAEVLGPRAGSVRFELICAEQDSERARELLRGVVEESSAPGLHLKRITVCSRPDPRGEVLALLGVEVGSENPVDDLDRCMLELYEGATEDSAGAATRIWRILSTARQKGSPPRGITLVNSSHSPPTRARSGRVIAGEEPTLAQLVDGCFALHEGATRSRYERFRSWADSDHTSCALPLFWIPGTSGSGKSVSLLQLVAEAHSRGWNPILHLGPRVELLPAAIELARKLRDDTTRPLISLDEPFSPGLRETAKGALRETLAKVEELRQDPNLGEPPLVLCAGSPEQVRMLREEGYEGSDGLGIHVDEPPPSGAEALGELREWYEARTGTVPEVHLPEDGPAILHVFAWGHGELRDYTDRLRIKLRSAGGDDLSRFAAEALALNRLGIGYPEQALTSRLGPESREALDRLREHGDLPLGNLERGGMWIAHPRLAAELVEHWHPSHREDPDSDERDFIAAASASIEHYDRSGQLECEAVRVLTDLRSVSVTQDRRVDRSIVRCAPQLYRRAVATAGRPLPPGRLSTWLELRFRDKVEWPDDPSPDALEYLESEPPTKGWARLARVLLENVDALNRTEVSSLRSSVYRCLAGDLAAPHWVRVATLALEVFPDARLLPLVDSWVAMHPRSRDSGRLLQASLGLQSDGENFDRLLARAHASLRQRDHPGWGFIWSGLWERGHSPELAFRAEQWLEEEDSFLDRSWSWVWQKLWGARDEGHVEVGRLVGGALEFLDTQTDQAAWAPIWTALWESRASLPRDADQGAGEPASDLELTLVESGRDWLARYSRTDGWGHVWEGLWISGHREGLRPLALDWLRGGEPSSGWGYVLPELMRSCEPSAAADLVGIARRWMRTAETEDDEWGYIFPAAWRLATEDVREALLETADAWLLEASDPHQSRGYVLRAIEDAHLSAEVLDGTVEWLEREANRDSEAWSVIWHAVLRSTPREQHLRMGLEWLRGSGPLDRRTRRPRIEHPGWPYVFKSAWTSCGKDEELRQELAELARKRLLEVRDLRPDLWISVAPEVMLAGADDPLFGEARRQLEAMPRPLRGWDRLWEAVFEAAPDAALAAEGLAWLREAALDDPAWGHVFCTLARFDVSEDLWLELVSWVEHAPDEAPAHLQLGPLVIWVRAQDTGGGITPERAETLRSLLPEVDGAPRSGYARPPGLARLLDLLREPDGETPGPDEVCSHLAISLPMLNGVQAHREWRDDWLEVWGRFTEAETFDLALRWLGQAPAKAGRSYVLKALWDRGAPWRASLVSPTFEYLEAADVRTKEWLPLREHLEELPPGILGEEERRKLHELEERYLRAHPERHRLRNVAQLRPPA